jgi:hypothetical protein
LTFGDIVDFVYYLTLVNNRPRIVDHRHKQIQMQQTKSKIPSTKTNNDDLKKLIQQRRQTATATNQNHDIEIFLANK